MGALTWEKVCQLNLSQEGFVPPFFLFNVILSFCGGSVSQLFALSYFSDSPQAHFFISPS